MGEVPVMREPTSVVTVSAGEAADRFCSRLSSSSAVSRFARRLAPMVLSHVTLIAPFRRVPFTPAWKAHGTLRVSPGRSATQTRSPGRAPARSL